MELYFNCYDLSGDGYTLRHMHRSGDGDSELEPIRPAELPAYLSECFCQGSTELCLDHKGDNWYGCARNIPSFVKDEERRNCFLNLALSAEPGNAKEAEIVRTVIGYARYHKNAFTAYMSRVIYYPAEAYAIDLKALDAMIASLSTETNATEPFRYLEGEWRCGEPDRNVFFYCSTPSTGYILKKIEPSSGLTYRFGTKAGMTASGQLLPYERKLLDNGGADIALFEQNGRCCFIIKGVKSQKQPGSDIKRLSFLIDVPAEDRAWLTRMASFALFSRASFVQMLTDCVQIYSDPRGFRVLPEKLAEFFDTVSQPVSLQDSADSEAIMLWQKINHPRQTAAFRFVVLETDYAYFERLCGIRLSENDGTVLISSQQAEKIASQMTALPSPTAAAEGDEHDLKPCYSATDENEMENIMAASVEKGRAERLSAVEKPNPVETPSPKEISSPAEALKPLEKSQFLKETAFQPQEDQTEPLEEDRIDLLDYKWFLPCVIGMLMIIIAVILLVAFNKSPEAANEGLKAMKSLRN